MFMCVHLIYTTYKKWNHHDSDMSKFENVFYDHKVKNIFEVSKIRRKDICGNSHAEI
jgi:hypothetical protein